MYKILNLVLIFVIFINTFLLLIDIDIRKIKVLKFSWILGGFIFILLIILKIDDSMAQYLGFSFVIPIFALGSKYFLSGDIFEEQGKINIFKYSKLMKFIILTVTMMFLWFTIVLTFYIAKHILFGEEF